MTEPTRDRRHGDPLSEVTRKERLYLLGTSSVGLIIVYTGLVPTEITTLGVKFAETDQRSLLFILALVIGYFLAAFVIYAASDFLVWMQENVNVNRQRYFALLERQRADLEERMERARAELAEGSDSSAATDDPGEIVMTLSAAKRIRVRETLSKLESDMQRLGEHQAAMRRANAKPAYTIDSFESGTNLLRAVFEFGLPIMVGLYTIAILVL